MAYRALYREYRPKLFSEVIGQDHITTALKNQIASGHVSHAYLFCGTRGTGKTSTAKILARAFNCLHPVDGEPCMECEACRAAMDPGNTDIQELDAASNTSVDDARALIEQAQYAPMYLRCRVFIIDEVHMLSKSAFNALLKTIEEPPAHVRFILATTEPQKLPATIISRCQRFDFHRLTTADIVSTLKTVLQKAGASIDDEGLLLIARAADGGMRDALSLTDQCLSFIGNRVTRADVCSVLGSMDRSFMSGLVDRLLAGDGAKALTMLHEALMQGRDLTVFTEDLIAWFRSVLFAAVCGRCEDLLDCTPEDMDAYMRQAAVAGAARARFALDALIDAENRMRFLPAPRTAVESALLRICAPESERTLEGLNLRLLKLERQGISGTANAPVPVRQEPPQAAPAAAPSPAEAPAPAVPPKREPAPEPAPSQADAESAPPPREEPAGPGREAYMLWIRVLDAITQADRLAGAVAKNGQVVSYENNTLVVGFPSDSDVKAQTFLRAIEKQKDAIASVSPGLIVRVAHDVPVAPMTDEEVERLRRMFGDRLVVED